MIEPQCFFPRIDLDDFSRYADPINNTFDADAAAKRIKNMMAGKVRIPEGNDRAPVILFSKLNQVFFQ